jgi:hypothetical protein
MSDTPTTDEAERHWLDHGEGNAWDLARELEREARLMREQFEQQGKHTAELARALKNALLIIEKAKPYVRDHACMTADDMRGLGGDAGDAYWLDVAESFTPKAQAILG